jgi:serine/threonine protein phosphatase PrpC
LLSLMVTEVSLAMSLIHLLIGCEVALFAKKYYVETLKNLPSFKENKYDIALNEVNYEIDEMLKDTKYKKELIKLANNGDAEGTYEALAGCTANVVLVTHDTIYCANAGDSRSVISRAIKNDEKKSHDCEPISIDHKPDEKSERERIEKGFGKVENGRVDGKLAVSRALGDL